MEIRQEEEQERRVVVVIPSNDVSQDVSYLQQRFRLESESSNCLMDDFVVLYLVEGPPSTVCWMVRQREGESTNSGQYLECLSLPGGSKLVCCDPSFVQDAAGRQQLGRFLANPSSVPPPQATLFPSLRTYLNDEPFILNQQAPVPFENDFFVGKMLMVCKPTKAESDPYWNEKVFSKFKRRLIINVQGRFKRQPKNLYAGAQVSQPMKLGLLTRGLCNVLLNLVERFNSNLHSSFGSDTEFAHICAPAHSFFERLIVTDPNESPPDMLELWDESKESKRQRQGAKTFTWDTTKTYSFSFFSMYVDLVTWKIVSLPATSDMNLQTFWGDSLLRIVLYDKMNDNDTHIKDHLEYAFCLTTKFLGEPSSDTLLQWSSRPKRVTDEAVPVNSSMDRSESMLFDPSENNTEADLEFFDAEEPEPIETGLTSSVDLLKEIDEICPCWIDICRGNGVHLKAFAVNMNGLTTFRLEQVCEDLVRDKLKSHIREHFSPRLSSSEKLRRSVALALSQKPSVVSKNKLEEFCSAKSSLDQDFLRGPTPTKSRRANVIVSGYVARALSDRHWIEEYCCIPSHGHTIQFFHNPDKRKPAFHISISAIRSIKGLDPADAPSMFGYHVLVLTTLGRSLYLMFASRDVLERWADILESLQTTPRQEESGSVSSLDTNASRAFEIDYPTDEFLHHSSMWHCKGRRLLNCAKFIFRQNPDLDPLVAAEEALAEAMTTQGDEAEEKRRLFLDGAAQLKAVDVNGLNEDARLAFFLNVYHLMISHAYLVLGPPDSSLKWISYFNNIAYQVGDEIFSFSELEHCIIRAEMSYPAQFLSRFVIPKSNFRIALKKQDFRINFALNCGSLSNPSRILIYRADNLNEQLDEAARLYLSAVACRTTSSRDLELTLPRVCQWFATDFGASRETLLKKLERLLPADVETQIEECRASEKRNCDIRFLPYNFECRALTL